MKRLTLYIILFFSITIYVVSSSERLTANISKYREKLNSPLGSDKHRYGDLFGIAYLSAFQQTEGVKPIFPDTTIPKKNIDLYAICDSYLFEFYDSAKYYTGVNKLTLVKTNNESKLKDDLSPSKKNVLLLEFSERNLREILENKNYMKNIISSDDGNTLKNKVKESLQEIYLSIFNSNINANIEYNIWDYSIFTKFKEFKADLNYNLFRNINNNVDISSNSKQLFYSRTIDTTDLESSFKYVSDQEVQLLIESLNNIAQKAKAIGFKKIYLSIVPNPVSVIEPNYNGYKYNNLVNRIQNSPNLKISYIDILPEFETFKTTVYAPSDTHWNWNGAEIWLRKINADLKTDNE